MSMMASHVRISIHALREEGDLAVLALLCAGADISIHALREEGDCQFHNVFLSV